MAKKVAQCFAANWERMLFVGIGLTFLGLCFHLLFTGKITEAAAVFGLGFLSFIYANVARFKRFKGLGFEAELWEDKKKEAADLIDRLREVVSIYTREVVLAKVTAGRLGGYSSWEERWKLYNDLVPQHGVLGQTIDFSSLKKEIDDYYLFDMTIPELTTVRLAVVHGKSAAKQKIDKEFGSPIKDAAGYSKRWQQCSTIRENIEDAYDVSAEDDLARHVLDIWRDAKDRLKRDFDVEIEVDPKVHERLERISKLYPTRPVQVTDELNSWANRDD